MTNLDAQLIERLRSTHQIVVRSRPRAPADCAGHSPSAGLVLTERRGSSDIDVLFEEDFALVGERRRDRTCRRGLPDRPAYDRN
jgi:hypothetical protein